ncbi:MAG TPA: Mur ligase family protein, partial [Bacteroidia bacterium]|nr:Mur ligase family protein [Bacteroidia bacterium]
MTYPEVLDYLYSCLPMFHRVGAVAYKANLDNTHHLMELLDHPEQGFRSVHVAGTNGKGSSSHMLAAVLQAAGYKTGLYTSPHLLDFRERIRVNGGMVPEEVVTGFVQAHRAAFDRIQPSFFEWTVALAFDYFRNEQVDIAIIETGLGGRLDSTNVITPEVALITNIGWDHMNLLGDTLEKIAAEKAGIIKPGVPVIISEGQPDTIHVLTSTAQRAGSNSCVADLEYKV